MKNAEAVLIEYSTDVIFFEFMLKNRLELV